VGGHWQCPILGRRPLPLPTFRAFVDKLISETAPVLAPDMPAMWKTLMAAQLENAAQPS
jgi:hypothetical protein